MIYGPANHSFSSEFLEKLDKCCQDSKIPIVLGEDLNLIREKEYELQHRG